MIRDSDTYNCTSLSPTNVDAVHRAVEGNNSFLTVATDKSVEYLDLHTETD
jgi:hypothetical protein